MVLLSLTLSSQSWFHLWCPSHLFRSDFFTCSLVLLPHPGSPTHSPCPWLQYSPHHWHITRTLKARLLQLTVLWSSKNPINSSPAYPESLAPVLPLLQLALVFWYWPDSQISPTGLRYRSVSNTKLFLPLMRFKSSTVFQSTLPSQYHYLCDIIYPAFTIHSVVVMHWSISFTHKLNSRVSKSLTALFGMRHLT